jgi:hypothetical protein
MQNSSFKLSAPMLRTATLLRISAAAVAVATSGGLAFPAQAGSLGRPCTSAPENQWLPMRELQAKVEALGYKVQKVKLKNACGELYTIDKTGNRVELFVDPTSGKIIGQL